MSPPAKDYFKQDMTEQTYLDSEPYSEFRREYIDGYVYAMAGATAAHNRIAGNVYGEIRNHLKGKPCQPYMSDLRVKVGRQYFYPDVVVDCSSLSDQSTFSESPTLIIEVLSKSTRQTDKTKKLLSYTQIASLEEYVLIDSEIVEIEVLRKHAGWRPECYYLGDDVTFNSIGLTLSVEAIYERVQHQDVADWLAKKAQMAAELLAETKVS